MQISLQNKSFESPIRPGIFILFVTIIFSCSQQQKSDYNLDELQPWCIVTFDSLKRKPNERITMLKDMGFTKYGYEGEDEYLDEMSNEFELAKKHNIEISSVFLWLNAKRDSLGKLSPSNEKILNNLKGSLFKPTVWVSFSNNYFEDLNQEQSLTKAIEYIKFIKNKTDETGCKLALYNHHGWFGNPNNQVKIIEALAQDSLTMVFNFHHAHPYLDEFPEIVKMIKPYLSHVNINGMKKDGPKILTVGEGDYEFEMVKLLVDAGYQGPWGILGHIASEDVQKVLERNIKGINTLKSNLHKELN